MSTFCRLVIGEELYAARAGERLLDAALTAGADLAHDCPAGHCGPCRVRVVDGRVIGGETGEPGVVRACQCVVLSDLCIEPVAAPEIVEVEGEVVAISDLTSDVAELTVATRSAFVWQPGQYAQIRFAGYPARAYSPTMALDGRDWRGTFRLHIRRLPGGRVSGAIGDEIGVGHRVTIEGPLGTAVLEPGRNERLALFSGGTGFAPIWAIADAALRERASRPMLLVVGARAIRSFYMAIALERLARCPNVTVVPIVAEPQHLVPSVETGQPSDLARLLLPGDIVHAAGAPRMVEALGREAAARQLPFHADPFLASAPEEESLLARTASRFASGRQRLGAAFARTPAPVPAVRFR